MTGTTWEGGLLLDERFEVSYPDSTQAPDGTIYVSYDRNRATDGEILLARITEADILAGDESLCLGKGQNPSTQRPELGHRHIPTQ